MLTTNLIAAVLMAPVLAFTGGLSSSRPATSLCETKGDLEALAKKLNPSLGFFDPLGLVNDTFLLQSNEATIGWLRHSEIKHGRVAMAAFVGYCVQSVYHFPWALTLDRQSYPSVNLSPPEQWDALPTAGKLQILIFVGFLEFFSEAAQPVHYTKGGKPGEFPPFLESKLIPHPVPLNLYDPFGQAASMDDEKKATRLRAEINNGRLAMIGIMGFLTEQKIPGSVPLLTGIVKPYAGEVMSPF
ncbi:hypothetical protein FisN_17Lh258 [Fistulifera solaris]|uniref:Uncharacterized protein n=1 Tax=Fistulifera solaris TaxID=1519565 RepID=A0A1Z5KM57_FISSO|nr:hypothetical protein FisN_17Lh258 [Fistulifera solaris]|eukprot:GAX27359.1 hypothetical protein FisN_17Lh258 [Fistulifera solaris]